MIFPKNQNIYSRFNNIKIVRTEILILLMSGFEPAVVSRILEVSLDTVYYNNRQLKKGYAVINKVDLDKIKERVNKE